jgi:hypothetical protein
MSRYFFHVHEHSRVSDDHGIELPDEEAAKRHGVMMLGQILRDEPQTFWVSGRIQVTATTYDGLVLFTLEVTSDRPEAASPRRRRARVR